MIQCSSSGPGFKYANYLTEGFQRRKGSTGRKGQGEETEEEGELRVEKGVKKRKLKRREQEPNGSKSIFRYKFALVQILVQLEEKVVKN